MFRLAEVAAALVRDPRDLPPPDHSGASIRRAAREITSRPEFRRPGKSLTQTVLDWLSNLLDRITRISGGTTVVGLVILAAALALIGWFVYRATRTLRADPRRAASVIVDVGRPATDWRAEAATHDAAGRWREALRCRYRALIADLAGAGTVREVPGRTTGEYRAAVARQLPPAAADFAVATDLFERAWYGAETAGPDENRRFDEAAQQVMAAVAAAGRRPVPAGVGA